MPTVFDHVTIHVADRAESERFYRTVLPTIGVGEGTRADAYTEWDDFSLSPATGEKPPTRGLHIGFAAPSRDAVDEWWRSGTAAGFRSDGEPGPRPQYTEDYYGSFLLDPDGNSAEAVHHGGMRRDGLVDHLWIRVADVEASGRFYTTIAAACGFSPRAAEPSLKRFSSGSGSFSVLSGEPLTQHLHMAFPASSNAEVDEFHRIAVDAGYRDNGAPGERPEYHPGYYAAFVLDPDGNNIELVNHNR